MVEDAAIVRPGYRAEFGPAVCNLQRLHLFGTMRGEAILQVDRRQRGRKLPQVGSRRADQPGQLAEAPVRGGNRLVTAGQQQGKPFGIIARRFHPDRGTLDRSGVAAFRAPVHAGIKLRQRQISLVIRPREPLRRHPPDPLATGHIHFVTAIARRRRHHSHVHHHPSPRQAPENPSRLSTRQQTESKALTLNDPQVQRSSQREEGGNRADMRRTRTPAPLAQKLHGSSLAHQRWGDIFGPCKPRAKFFASWRA